MTDTSNTNENKPRRGRKPLAEGGKSSPQEIFCIAVGGGNHAKFKVAPLDNEDHKQVSNEELVERGRNLFAQKFGIEADEVYGPVRDRKGAITTSGTRRARPPVKMDEVNMIPGRKAVGVFNDWNVNVRFIQNHDDCGMIFFKDHVDSETKKKAKPNNRVVYLTDIVNLKEEVVNQD